MMKKVLSLAIVAASLMSFTSVAQITSSTDNSGKAKTEAVAKEKKAKKASKDDRSSKCEKAKDCVKGEKCAKAENGKCAKGDKKCAKAECAKGQKGGKQGKGPKGAPGIFSEAAFDGIQLTDAQKAGLTQLKEQRMAKRAEMKEQGRAQKMTRDSVARVDRKKAQKEYLEEVKAIIGPDQYVVFLENIVMNGQGGHQKAMMQQRKGHDKGHHAAKGQRGDNGQRGAKGQKDSQKLAAAN